MVPRRQRSANPATFSSPIRTDEATRAGAAPRWPERSQQRVLHAVPLVVSGLGCDGRLFHELSSTRDVSPSGCRIHVCTRPQSDSPLAIRFIRHRNALEEELQILFQVIWVKREGTGWAVGARCLVNCDFRALIS